jgi:putative DNA primase/helicase
MPGTTAGSSVDREGRALVERLGGRWTANGGLCRCPAHDDRSPSLSVRPGRTRLLLHCFAGCAAGEVLRALASNRLIEPGAAASGIAGAVGSGALGTQAAALRLWGAARVIRDSPAAAYLDARGLAGDSPELRFHPRTPHGPKPLTRFRPALIAAVRDPGGLVAIHRTFLDLRQRRVAALAEAKCGLGPFGRGAVRLGGVGPRLGLAEGIETALSASILFGVPCWATLGTERFALVALPTEVSELLLFLDNDAGGRRAEALAREAFTGLASVEAYYPRGAGADWNDVLRARLRGATGR